MSGATASRVRAVETHAEIGREIRELMWRDVGLVRTGDGLQNAVHGLTRVARRLRPGVSETDNLLTVAGLVTQAAFVRRESRGAHFRSDDVPTPGSRDETSVGNG
ncbi:MAG: hypothetical protein MK365_14450 [Vicinamibacterales bacterium]|jgi:aspartate oxidase|nr:hypothetical protein [Vicinamibacterales bacterium]